MKLADIKKRAYSYEKVLAAKWKSLFAMYFTIMGVFALAIGLFAFTTPNVSIDEVVQLGMGVQMATVMGMVGNIDSVSNKKRTGRQVKSKLWLLSADQIDESVPFPSIVNRTRGNIALKPGEYWHYIEAVIDSPEPKWTGEEGDVASPLNLELPFIVGGMEDATFDLLEQGVGEEFIIVWEICSTGEIFGGGNGCKGLKLTSFEGGSTKDNTSSMLTFKGQCGELWYKYAGNTPTQAADVITADAVTIPLTSNPLFQLTSGSAAAATVTGFSAVTDSDINRIVTVLGSGGAHPSNIDPANDFILVDGEAWTANEGAQISFKIFKDGASSYKFIEVSGSRV